MVDEHPPSSAAGGAAASPTPSPGNKAVTTGRTGGDATVEIATAAISMFKSVAFRLIDRGQVWAFLAFAVICVIAILAWRVPDKDIAMVPKAISEAVGPFVWAALVILAAGNIIQLVTSRASNRVYLAEIKRIGQEKSEQQRLMDPKRTSAEPPKPKKEES